MEQSIPTVSLGNPVQIALLVKDARRTTELLISLFGMGPWRFEDWPPQNRPEFESRCNGQPAKWRNILAFADWDNLEIELIECVEGETSYTEFLAKRGEGLHHLLFEVDDLDATVAVMAKRGISVKMGATGRRPGTRWVLLDTFDLFGFGLELRNKLAERDSSRAE